MQPSLKLDTLAMDRTFRDLAAFSPVELKPTLRAEAGSILKTCAARTKVAKPERAEIDARRQALRKGDATTFNLERMSVTIGMRNASAYGNVWRLTGDAKRLGVQQVYTAGFTRMNRHFGDAAWRDAQAVVARFLRALKTARPAVKGAAGLARQSWIHIADDLGIRLENVPGGNLSSRALAKARAAIASNGRRYKSGQASEEGANKNFLIRLTNTLPYGRKITLDRILVGAINGRIKFFQRNVALGVFKSLDKTLKAYPGIRLAYNGPPTSIN
jgi:hypothetical protein